MKHLAWIFIIVLFSSCGPSAEERVDAILQMRIDAYKAKKVKTCDQELLSRANEVADSMIIAQAFQDTTAKYVRPIRPEIDSIVLPDREKSVKPLFDTAQINQN